MNHRVISRVGVVVFLLLFTRSLLAEDIVLQSGQILKNAEIVSVDPVDATVRHDGGTGKFPLSVIPGDVLKRYRDQELRRKADEVEKLKQELAKQQKELKQLKDDNERLRREQKQTTAPAPAVPVPSRPLAAVPSIGPSDVIEVKDLVLYYESDRAAADQRFRKKEFRIRGVVAGFSPKLFIRWYDVGLESPSKSMNVICKFGYRDEWQSVYTTDRGRKLVAKIPRAEISILKTDQAVTIQCRCEGISGGDLEFDRCELVR